MKVAIISKADRLGGGASRVAEDHATWLNEVGIPTDHFIGSGDLDLSHDRQSLYGYGAQRLIARKTHRLTQKLGWREIIPIEYWLNLRRVIHNYDIIHFHDLHSAISPLTLAWVAKQKPTFFTVHDCSAFTGGCLYPMDCTKYQTNCGKCPQVHDRGWRTSFYDHSHELHQINRGLAAHHPVQYIFPSHWIAAEAHKSLTFKQPAQIIPYGLDLRPFPLRPKSTAKQQLGLPDRRPVITITAHYLQDPRKGVKHAIAALQSIADYNPIILVVGLCSDTLKQQLAGLETREMGFIQDPEKLGLVYTASDIVLFCTLADNLPLTVLETMAAGTMIVGFATGGVPDMIQSGSNGLLANPGDQAGLNQILRQAIEQTDLIQFGQQARHDVEKHFSPAAFVKSHLRLYQKASPERI
jgi:glycosyltransferase involved in cell wall biosynthesis